MKSKYFLDDGIFNRHQNGTYGIKPYIALSILLITLLFVTVSCKLKDRNGENIEINEDTRESVSKPSVSASQVDSQETFIKNLLSRDITPEILKAKNFLDSAELPESTEAVTNVRKTVESALNAWAECQEIVNSKKLNLQYNRGEIYTAIYEDNSNRIYFHFVLQSEKGEIRQCRKIKLPTELNNKRKALYKIYFNDDFNIELYRDPNDIVYFYPSGLIESISYDKPDGIIHSIKWSEDGNIIRQSRYDKNNEDTLLLEAKEKAKKMLTEHYERAQKEYEEYKRKLNTEEVGSSSDEAN